MMKKKKKKKKGDWIISDFKMAISMNNKYKIEKAVQICDRDAIFFQRENTFTRFIKISFERVYHLDTICFLFFKKDKKKTIQYSIHFSQHLSKYPRTTNWSNVRKEF